jgi:hypothetical protein
MAISDEEKKHILANTEETSTTYENLLDNEKNRIQEFCKNKNINIKEN